MPGMPEVMAKPLMLKKLDDLFNDPTRRPGFMNDVRTMDDLYEIATKHKIADSFAEKWHLREHWFKSWWPQAQAYEGGVKRIMHEAFRVLCKEFERKARHVDFYWVCDPGHGHHPHPAGSTNGHQPDGEVEVTVSWSDAQITFILQTPHPPVGSPTGPVLEPIWVVKRDGHGNVITVQASRPPDDKVWDNIGVPQEVPA